MYTVRAIITSSWFKAINKYNKFFTYVLYKLLSIINKYSSFVEVYSEKLWQFRRELLCHAASYQHENVYERHNRCQVSLPQSLCPLKNMFVSVFFRVVQQHVEEHAAVLRKEKFDAATSTQGSSYSTFQRRTLPVRLRMLENNLNPALPRKPSGFRLPQARSYEAYEQANVQSRITFGAGLLSESAPKGKFEHALTVAITASEHFRKMP